MIEKALLDYLNSTMDVPCYMEVPAEGTSFIVLEKTAGSVYNNVYSDQFAIQSYSDTLYNASLLNEALKEAMESFTTVSNISKAKLNSDYNYTDTTTKRYRYQAVYDITYLKEI